jgi:hypothetical protein
MAAWRRRLNRRMQERPAAPPLAAALRFRYCPRSAVGPGRGHGILPT